MSGVIALRCDSAQSVRLRLNDSRQPKCPLCIASSSFLQWAILGGDQWGMDLTQSR